MRGLSSGLPPWIGVPRNIRSAFSMPKVVSWANANFGIAAPG